MLRRGQTFTVDGVTYKVATVTPSRAHAVCVLRHAVSVEDKRTGKVRTFTVSDHRSLDISPNAELGLLAEFQRTGRL